MIKIALCDDNEIERGILKNVVEGLLIDIGYSAQVFEFSSGEKLLRNYSRGDYDVIFLDVQMKQLDGIETGRAIREKDVQVEIIFATSSEAYMKEGYDIHALAYLFKPYRVEKVRETLEYYLKKYDVKKQDEKTEMLEVTIQQKKIFIRQRDIYFLESMGRVVSIYCKNGVFKVYSRLGELEEKLDSDMFLRCNQSYIVNILWVSDIVDYDFYMPGDRLVPIRKRDKKEIIQKFYNKRNETDTHMEKIH